MPEDPADLTVYLVRTLMGSVVVLGLLLRRADFSWLLAFYGGFSVGWLAGVVTRIVRGGSDLI